MAPSSAEPASAAGTWRLGDRTVDRMGLGAMRPTGTAPFHGGTPRPRETALAVLRRAVELQGHVDENVASASLRLSVEQMERLAG